MEEFAGFFGWVAIMGFVFELANYVIKLIHKRYISKLPREKQQIAKTYRFIMKIVTKNHKLVGMITLVAAILHFAFMYLYVRMRVSGLVAIVLLLVLLGLGFYGAFINKNYKGKWLKAHRAIALLLVLVLGAHLL